MSAAETVVVPELDASEWMVRDDGTLRRATMGDAAAEIEGPSWSFAGLPASTIVLGVAVLLLALLSAWQTREILALRSHKIVSVSLATLLHDYIAAEAHNPGSPEITAVRTKLYIGATQAAVRGLSEQGYTVLVTEAVAGDSAPDVTPQVKADIEAKLKAVQVSATMGAK